MGYYQRINMRSLKAIVLLSLLLITLSVITSGQTTTPKCPELSVDVPGALPRNGDTIIFTLKVKGVVDKRALKIHWYISSGKMTGGQGTDKLRVLLTNEGVGITASAELKGLPNGCRDIVSGTSPIYDLPPGMIQYDEYGAMSLDEEETRIKALLPQFADHLRAGSRVVLHLFVKRKETVDATTTRIRRIFSFLRSEIGGKAFQFQFQVEKTNVHVTKVYVVLVGASPPICGRGCKMMGPLWI